jgi:hypothetical protein
LAADGVELVHGDAGHAFHADHPWAAVVPVDLGGGDALVVPGKDLSQGCFMAMIVRDGTWQRLTPADAGYLC